MKLQKQFGDKVVCMSVALDYDDLDIKDPKDAIPDVKKMLTKINAHLENFVSGDVDEDFMEKSGITSPPTTLVYDKTGQLHKKVDVDAVGGEREVTYAEDIVPLVEKLLAE